MNVLDKPITLCLNSSWQPIGTRSVREAILAMNSTNASDDRAAVALDIQYIEIDGQYIFDEPAAVIPVAWDDWIKLPIRPFDETITTPHMTIRAPTVVVARHYSKMPVKSFRPSKKTIYERDKGICQYTGQPVSYNQATLDHVHPRSKGGKDTFDNLVLCAPEVNFKKGNKSNNEAGLKLIRQPKAPQPVPVIALITEARHRDWAIFLAKNQ